MNAKTNSLASGDLVQVFGAPHCANGQKDTTPTGGRIWFDLLGIAQAGPQTRARLSPERLTESFEIEAIRALRSVS